MAKLRREDEVVVVAGRDKGNRGTIQKVMNDGRLVVSGINMIKKHQKPNPQLQIAGGIVEQEAPIQASNVAIWNAETEKADRVAYQISEDGEKVRVFKSTKQEIGA